MLRATNYPTKIMCIFLRDISVIWSISKSDDLLSTINKILCGKQHNNCALNILISQFVDMKIAHPFGTEFIKM